MPHTNRPETVDIDRGETERARGCVLNRDYSGTVKPYCRDQNLNV